MKSENFGWKIEQWAQREAAVGALVLIGSRVRATDDAVWQADAHSDWDFQIITSKPAMFADAAWARALPEVRIKAYAVRGTLLGRVPKVNAIFSDAEADFVILPAGRLRVARILVGLGRHQYDGWLRRGLQDLATVIRPGWRFLKGAASWEPFYRRIVEEVRDPRIEDTMVCALAEGFVCDYVWSIRKLGRGELLAVQRMLHRELAETNFRLLHELKLRRGERSFPDARRVERVADVTELAAVGVDARREAESLRAAVEHSAETLRGLMRALVGDAWCWPDV